jgi:hypothetical protein
MWRNRLMRDPLNFEDAAAALSVQPDLHGAVEALTVAELEVALDVCRRYATTSEHQGFAVLWSELAVLLEREKTAGRWLLRVTGRWRRRCYTMRWVGTYRLPTGRRTT